MSITLHVHVLLNSLLFNIFFYVHRLYMYLYYVGIVHVIYVCGL